MNLKQAKELKKKLQEIDMDALREIQAKVEQDVAFATYEHNIYVAGFIHGLEWDMNHVK